MSRYFGCFAMGFCLCGLLFSLFLSYMKAEPEWRVQEQAVQAGHAEFYLDKDHHRQWRWLATPQPKQP